ncbi:MAG TPA: hypothetical protein VF407_14115, partial [Polyangiaceae bacterium]
CGATSVEEKLAIVHAEKPTSFERPKEWRPRRGSDLGEAPLRYKTDVGDWLPPVFVLAILLFVGAEETKATWLYPFYGVVPADLARVSPIGAPADVGKALQGADVRATSISARLRSGSAGAFDHLSLDWGKSGGTAPKTLTLSSEKAPLPAADIRARLGKILHGGFDGSRWIFGDVSLTLRPDARELGIVVEPKDNPLFERQVVVSLHVLGAAAFGDPLSVSDAEMKAVYGGAYPITDLAKIAPATLAPEADARVMALFPGAFPAFTSYRFGVDHPIVSFVTLQWDPADEHGGRLREIDFDFAVGAVARRSAWITCLAQSLGAPKAGGGDAYWQLGDARTDSQFFVRPDHADMRAYDVFPADKYAAVVAAIDRCR